MLGERPELEGLCRSAKQQKLKNMHLPGRVSGNLSEYLIASDVLLIPGRGGIVISEALAHELPVLVHEADGTEHDLVINDKTGFILKEGSAQAFAQKLQQLISNPELCRNLGKTSRELIETQFNTEKMIRNIEQACRSAQASGTKLHAKPSSSSRASAPRQA